MLRSHIHFSICVCPAWALVSKIPYYSRGCKSLVRGFVTRSIASRKVYPDFSSGLVWSDPSSEGSETAKPGSRSLTSFRDRPSRNWIQRLYRSDEAALPVPSIGMILTSQGWLAIKYLCSRSSGYWVKEYVLIPLCGTGSGEILE